MQNPRILVGLCAAAFSLLPACSAPTKSVPAPEESIGQSSAATAFANDHSTYVYFRQKGFTSFQAAGIVGNLDQESGINPTISQQNGGPGRGIAQWSAGGRWDSDPGDNLMAFAKEKGKSPTALDTQLDFIMFELDSFPGYGLAKLKASQTLADATTDFELDFEGCGIPAQCDAQSRQDYAQDVFDEYGDDPVAMDLGVRDGAGASDDAGSATDAATPG